MLYFIALLEKCCMAPSTTNRGELQSSVRLFRWIKSFNDFVQNVQGVTGQCFLGAPLVLLNVRWRASENAIDLAIDIRWSLPLRGSSPPGSPRSYL
jgi:hypothetical protein